jgi:hypothetical protein
MGPDGFTFPPKGGVLRIFRPKNPTALAGCKPANLGNKGRHATCRPPKPLNSDLFGTYIYSVGFGDFSRSATLSIIVLVVTIAFSSVYVVQLLKEDS